MDRGVKIVLALVVLTVGLVGAMSYRHRNSAPEILPPPEGQPMVLRRYTAPVAPPEAGPSASVIRSANRPTDPDPAGGPSATIRARLEDGGSPPELAREYPRDGNPTRGGSRDFDGPRFSRSGAGRSGARFHTVIDGDTLAELARRYLGSARRQNEIFEANREVLSTGLDALPLGVKLRIPPRLVPVELEPSPRQGAQP